MINGDCRIPRANPNIKMITRDDWDKLHKVSYDLMCELNQCDLSIDEVTSVCFERFIKEWRRHIALPRDCETWLEDRRNARANEVIPD